MTSMLVSQKLSNAILDNLTLQKPTHKHDYQFRSVIIQIEYPVPSYQYNGISFRKHLFKL
jgi:hypothetical protein